MTFAKTSAKRFLKKKCLKTIQNHSLFPDCQNVFSQSLVFILFIYKVVAVTMNMAEYATSWQSAVEAA